MNFNHSMVGIYLMVTTTPKLAMWLHYKHPSWTCGSILVFVHTRNYNRNGRVHVGPMWLLSTSCIRSCKVRSTSDLIIHGFGWKNTRSCKGLQLYLWPLVPRFIYDYMVFGTCLRKLGRFSVVDVHYNSNLIA
jgi:hypothetical protein